MFLSKHPTKVEGSKITQIWLRDDEYHLIAECGAWENVLEQERADEIVTAVNERLALLAHIAELEAALKPLAEVGKAINPRVDADSTYIWAENSNTTKPVRLSVADAIRAARLLDGDK